MSSKKLPFATCCLLAGLYLAACSPAVPLPQPIQSVIPTPAEFRSPLTSTTNMPEAFATPEAGKAAARGTLITTQNFAPLPGTQFYLKPVGDLGKPGEPWTLILVGPEPNNGDVVSQTGPRGEFFVNNVPPGKYFLIVWAPYNWIPVSSDPTDAQPMQFELKADEIADFGSLTISWP